jgi:acetoin utilization protein AcuB
MFEMLGARKPGVRFSVLVPNKPGEIAQLTQAIYEKGGTILALTTFEGDSSANGLITVKVDGIAQDKLVKIVEPLVIKILDICTD